MQSDQRSIGKLFPGMSFLRRNGVEVFLLSAGLAARATRLKSPWQTHGEKNSARVRITGISLLPQRCRALPGVAP